MNERAPVLDGSRMAVLANRLEGIARKMGNTLLRSGRSGVLNRAQDFSCCITTAAGELLAAAESLPIHVLGGAEQVMQMLHECHPDAAPGDAYLHNSPYHGNTHAADHIVFVPIFDDEGRHRFTAIAKAHQADIGNSLPTTYAGAARDVYEEGALIFPCVRVQRGYRNVEDIIRMCKVRIRVPDQWYGDYLAALGAARIGERDLHELGAEIGWDSLSAFAERWFSYSEQRMRSAIAALPAGTAVAMSTHDPFPGTPAEGVTIKVKVKIDPRAGCIEVDLRDNIDCLPCGLNLSETTARVSAMIGVYNSIDYRVPRNAGSNRRIRTLLREGCVVGIPRHPTSCSVATTNIADRVANATQRAMADLGDGIGMAECGAIIPPACGVISGIDPRSDRPYVNQMLLGFTGGAGSPHGDAWLTVGHVGNAGMARQDSVEMAELYQPIHVYRKELLADSEGAGANRGSPALLIEFGPAASGCFEVGYVCDGIANPALGARGGGAGRPAAACKRTVDGSLVDMAACAQVACAADETIVSVGAAGGGYGDPARRSPYKVIEDFLDGYVSRERAHDVYAVVITADGTLDEDATAHLRARRP